ncbi:MAG: hypothetical protein NT118_15595 [Lentisphaerae bacterium]|nr:hypothetical protein [Lentisphaerota bacterium]
MKSIFTLFVFGMAMTAMVSFAQDAGGKGGKEGKRPTPPVVSALDVNGDGVIDAKEIADAPAELKKLDKNSDGKLEADEIRPARPAGAAEGDKKAGEGKGMKRPPSPLISALDANGDGVIDEKDEGFEGGKKHEGKKKTDKTDTSTPTVE